MLLPTIGVVGEIPAASFICLVLGLLRMPLSASAPLVFFFSFFLFLFLFLLGSLASNDTLCVMSTLLDASTWPAVLSPEEKKIYLFAQRVLSNHLISSF